MNNLVTTEWLTRHLSDFDLRILDATWHLPSAKREAHAEYLQQHIPGARFFDLDKVSDTESSLPHMLPSADKFAAHMAALGISDRSRVICYDSYGLFSAARCWWMFKVFGHAHVAVMNGGLKKWIAEGGTLETGEPPPPHAANYRAIFNSAMVRALKDVATSAEQIVDARSLSRFKGEEPEPRPGVRPGHMPGAKNLYYGKLVGPTGEMHKPKRLEAEFRAAHVNLKKPVVTSCGSGVTAAILSLALTELGAASHALYDGSWAEWGASEQKIEMGS